MGKPQIIFRDGRPQYAVIPWAEYTRLAGSDPLAMMSDEELFDAARASGEERFPVEIVDRLLAGQSPLKVYREYRGLTQKELARKAKITLVYLSQIETGVRRGSLSVVGTLAKVLGVDLDDLVRK